MTAIGDSDALRDRERLLPQHQAALTLLQARLSSPDGMKVRWLDLACGRGQIIVALDRNLSTEARANLQYWAYDINQQFARETRRTAETLGLDSVDIKVGDLRDFNTLYPPEMRFDFITLTNTVHEVEPAHLAAIIIDSILRLAQTGTLFLYDMERIRPPELGAVPWNRDEMQRIVKTIFDGLGVSNYHPEVGQWMHQTCNAWNVQLQRQYFGITSDEAIARRPPTVRQTTTTIIDLLERKLELCRTSLETLTLCGAETAEEAEDKERLLYEFWAVSRALEGIR